MSGRRFTGTGGNGVVSSADMTGSPNPYEDREEQKRAASVGAGTSPNRIDSARELERRAAEPGAYHNFPEYYNAQIVGGNRQVISDNYVLYTQRGSINGVRGTFQIGVRPSASGRTETIVHRFFLPDGP